MGPPKKGKGRNSKQVKKASGAMSVESDRKAIQKLQERRMQAARVYLASMDVAWNVWAKVHAQGAILKGTLCCKNGGWAWRVSCIVC